MKFADALELEFELSYPPVALPRTEQRVLESEAVGASYALYISLPRDYGSTDRSYPVVYLLDADYSLSIARNIVEHLSDRRHLTRAILVGFAYDGPPAYRRNRTRDCTPTHVPAGGYGPAFQAFMADELMSFVEREYRVSDRRVLVGHSYGGLFATWVALTAPRDVWPVRIYMTAGSGGRSPPGRPTTPSSPGR